MKNDKMGAGWVFGRLRENMCIESFVGKPEIRKPYARTKHRWDDNTDTDI
jgi:hypothetical protein